MLVDCFLPLWFRGLINLGEYSEGKATRNPALAVYKSGALRSVNTLPKDTGRRNVNFIRDIVGGSTVLCYLHFCQYNIFTI